MTQRYAPGPGRLTRPNERSLVTDYCCLRPEEPSPVSYQRLLYFARASLSSRYDPYLSTPSILIQ